MNTTELQNWVSLQIVDNNSFKSVFLNSDLNNLVACIDLTTLNATDSPSSVDRFVSEGMEVLKSNQLPNVAAFCVFSNFTKQVKAQLKESEVHTACVATAFPHGQADLESKTLEVKVAAQNGADDIDVVINRGMVLDNDYSSLATEIKSFNQAKGAAHLKVILEVCELNLDQVYKSSMVAMENGADFIKTSTGKGSSGASIETSLVMCKAIKDYFEHTNRRVGFKAAGGISTSQNAMQYWNVVKHILGDNWLDKRYFRIGASSLLKNIIIDLQ